MQKDQVYWYTLFKPSPKVAQGNVTADIVIVGGGMAGLMAAKTLSGAGKSVMVIESDVCGGGASGKSSGFITPDSELELSDFVREFGDKDAHTLWDFVTGGVNQIKETIEKNNIECDYVPQESLFVATTRKAEKEVRDEHDIRVRLGYQSNYFSEKTLPSVIGSKAYLGGVNYSGTFGMSTFLFCQKLKDILISNGVQIFEKSPVKEIHEGKVLGENFSVAAGAIIVATDYFLPQLRVIPDAVYHAQTFLAVSKPLSAADQKKMFPHKPLMVWDTDLIYQYYRLTKEGRLLIGASDLIYTYGGEKKRTPAGIIRKMQKYVRRHFPQIFIDLEYTWPGLIGVSKDFVPLAGEDKHHKGMYYIGGAAGLPWAAALGKYIGEKILSGRADLDHFFTADRKFPIGKVPQYILTKPISFAISHGIKKYLA